MKKLYVLNGIVIVLCVVGTAVLLMFTPDTIPAHYNFAGEIDRFGSKYESLLFPFFSIIMGGFFVLLAKQEHKKGEAKNEKILLYSGALILIFFTATGFYSMFKAITYDSSAAASVNIDVIKFVNIAIGVLFIALGNIMPKIRRNSVFGLRTKWSMSNDSVWQKSQRFSGIASVICGFVMIMAATFVSGVWNIILVSIVLFVWLFASVIASYRYCKADKVTNNSKK